MSSSPVPDIVESHNVYQGRVLEVRKDRIRRKDGSESEREVVVHPDCVAMACFLPDGRLVLLDQYRHPVGRYLCEVPAGKIDPGESPLDAAKRELIEECGLTSARWSQLASFYSSPGYTTERMVLFVARDCEPIPEHAPEADIASWRGCSREEAMDAVSAGRVACAKTLLALAMVGWLWVEGG